MPGSSFAARAWCPPCAPIPHDLLVLPSTYLANSKEAEPYAFGFSVRSTHPGLRFICRPSVIHQNAASPMDYPLSARFDETDAMVVFDDVLVPWERVFIHRDAELCNGLYNRTGIMPQIMHQFSTKNLAKAEFMMGLGLCDRQVDQHRPASARPGHAGRADPVHRVLPRLPPGERGRCRAGTRRRDDPGGDAAVDGADDVSEDVRADVRDHSDARRRRARRGSRPMPSSTARRRPTSTTYFQAANADAATRIKLFRLAFDAAVSSFSGRQQLYERYYSGDPVRLAGTLYGLYDKDTHIDRIVAMLDEMEAHHPPPVAGEG